MNITDNGLNEFDHYAEKNMDVSLMVLVQILREVRELRGLLKQGNDTDDSGERRQKDN